MRQLTGNEVMWITVVSLFSFIPAYQFVVFGWIGREEFTNIAHSYALGMAFTVWLQWIPAVRRAFAGGYRSGADMLAVALWVLMGSLIYIRGYALIVFVMERPPWILASFLVPLAPWVLGSALVMMMFAPGVKDGNVPLRNYGWFVFAGFIGCMLTGISIGFGLKGAIDITQ